MNSHGINMLRWVAFCLFWLLSFSVVDAVNAQNLAGPTGSSSKWGSGWLDLAPPVDFAKGDRLRLLIGGTADRIIVRLLPKGISPDTSTGVLGGAIAVSKSRIAEVIIPGDRKQIVQISVHGGPNPWGRFPLGGANGPATLESAERLKR